MTIDIRRLAQLVDDHIAEQSPVEPIIGHIAEQSPAEPIIGHILGQPVYGIEGDPGDRIGAHCMLAGFDLHAYPRDPRDRHSLGDYLSFTLEQAGGCDGDIAWSDWGRMRELARMDGDPVGQLMALARRWCAEGEAEQRRAA